MEAFVFEFPTKVVFGRGEFESLGKWCDVLGDRILLVTGRHFALKHGYVERIERQLHPRRVVLYNNITPNPKTEEVEEGAELARREGITGVLAFGGGSVMDAAKLIAGLAVNEGRCWDYAPHVKRRKFSSALPVVTVPTVAASGSEANPYAVITNLNEKEKVGFYSPFFYPKVAVVDPELTYTLPLSYTADGVVDIMVHALETYLSGEEAALQDRFTEGLVAEVMRAWEWLRRDRRIEKARETLSWASTLAISPFLHAGRGGYFVLHGIEHAVSAYYDSISHGKGLAALLPSFLSRLVAERPERLSSLFKALFDVAHPEEGLSEFVRWMKEEELFTELKELGVKEEDLSVIARHSFRINEHRFEYMGWDAEVIEEILKGAY